LLVKHLYTPALVTSLAALWSAAPGRVPIQRDGDPRVTCHVVATALAPGSASAAADYRRNGPAVSWRSSPRPTPRSRELRALVSQG